MAELHNSRYEDCQTALEQLTEYYSANIANRNEATTRLHLINSLVYDCLGWEKQDVIAEEHQRKQHDEYTDYTFYAPRRILILEAKRESAYFEIPAGKTALTYSLKSICRGNADLKAAVDQVAGYCQSRGVPLAAVCNGHQLMAFVAVRSDGVAPMDGKVVVFSSLHFMLEHFPEFWNVLSCDGIQEHRLANRLLGTHRPELPPTLSSSISHYPGTKGRNVFQSELQHLSELVVEDIPESESLEGDFLRNCYCHSGALSQHSLASKAILRARYAALFDTSSPARPSVTLATNRDGVTQELYAEGMSRRPILLLGDVGVGKSTFIRHLISIDASDLFDDAIAIRIDLGAQATLTFDLRNFVVSEITQQLADKHSFKIQKANIVRGIYHRELEDFKDSIYGELAESDPDKFKAHELDLLETKLADKSEHCRRALEHLTRARKKQVVIFIDNADQRGDATQDEAFLVAQEMATHWPALVYVPLRPETFHRSVGQGALSGYHPKAFTILPPRVDKVLERRLQYALRIADGIVPSAQVSANSERIESLKKIIRSFLKSLRQNDDLLECIDNIAGGNVRLALSLVKGFFGSGHVDTQKIVEKSNRHLYSVPLHEFLRAAIYGDSVHFHPDRSPFANLFDLLMKDTKEHFILPILLGLLRQAGHGNKGFVKTDDVYSALQGLGFAPDQIDYAIVRGYRKRLIETSANQTPEATGQPRLLRATTVGLYHVDRLCGMFTYVDAMIVATPILDEEVRTQISDEQSIVARLERAEVFSGYLDEQWSEAGFPALAFHWPSVKKDLDASIKMVRRRLPH